MASAVYGVSDAFIQVSPPPPPPPWFASRCLRQLRFACDVSIGVDFHLAETRAQDTFNYLLVSL
jgi:hypothetical protein